MTPAAIMRIDAIPLTRNRKLDRAALPAPSTRMRAERVSPRNALERDIARVWASVLRVDAAGVTDDFSTPEGFTFGDATRRATEP